MNQLKKELAALAVYLWQVFQVLVAALAIATLVLAWASAAKHFNLL